MLKTICVVEDNADNRLLVHALLDDQFVVVEYCDGPSALAGLQAICPDLILLDISLPEMDGLEVLRRIRSNAAFRTIPVIALTAHAMAGDRARLIAAGFDEYVTKPIADETLLFGAIDRCLTARSADSTAGARA